MKALVCEMCNSNDLVKQDGLYVCQNCGTKYTVEEAKKLMFEGTLDVSGSTVKVDDSAELNNLYELARRSRDINDHENSMLYYKQILLKNPSDWEANLYSLCFEALTSDVKDLESCTIKVANSIPLLLKMADEIPDSEERLEVFSEVCTQLTKTCHAITKSLIHIKNLSRPVALSVSSRIRNTLCDYLISHFSEDEEVFTHVCIPILEDKLSGQHSDDRIGDDFYIVPNRFTHPYINAIRKYKPNYLPPEESFVGYENKKKGWGLFK